MKRVAIALLFLAPAVAYAEPFPITDIEKFACEMVAGYLAKGPAAVVERLSESSPFRRVDADTVEAEIEARLGPSEGARWELRAIETASQARDAAFHIVFPSGAEEVVTFSFVRDDSGALHLNTITTLGEIFGLAARRRHDLMTTEVTLASMSEPMRLLLIAMPVLALMAALIRRIVPRTSKFIFIAALAAFIVPFAAWVSPPWLRSIIHRDALNAPDIIPMKELVPLRRAMAAGKEIRYPAPKDPDANDIATLWTASLSPSEEMEQHLAAVKNLTDSPLAKLVRARLASAAGEYAKATQGYSSIGAVSHNAFWEEAWIARELIDDGQRPYHPGGPLESNTARDANIWYAKAIREAIGGRMDQARPYFREGWRLKPISRAEILEQPILPALLSDPTMIGFVNFRTPAENASGKLSAAANPMTVPEGTRATSTGKFIRLTIGQSQLDIPGGAEIAPKGTEALSPTAFSEAEGEDAVRRVEHLESPALDSAAMQRTVYAAASVLAGRNDWNRVLKLTAAMTHDSENVPLVLVRLRVAGLVWSRRFDEARDLVASKTMQRAIKRDADSDEMFDIAHMLGRAGAWDDAISMLSQASSVEGARDVTATYQRFKLRRELAASKPLATTAHFDIHATSDVAPAIASRIGDLLEAELQRLTPRFGINDFERVRVNLLPWHIFAGLTGSFHILGFYDGEIAVPFGEVESFREQIVATLTHELTHAIIDQISGGNVPRWINEGIAERMELLESHHNAFQLRAPGQIMALELLDAFIRSSGHPADVGEAYMTSQTFIRFLEHQYGQRAINDLLAAFRDGKNTAEALETVTKLAVVDLDRDFRTWGLTNAGPFLDRTPWPYAHFYSVGIDPKVMQGIRWSRPKPDRPRP